MESELIRLRLFDVSEILKFLRQYSINTGRPCLMFGLAIVKPTAMHGKFMSVGWRNGRSQAHVAMALRLKSAGRLTFASPVFAMQRFELREILRVEPYNNSPHKMEEITERLCDSFFRVIERGDSRGRAVLASYEGYYRSSSQRVKYVRFCHSFVQ